MSWRTHPLVIKLRNLARVAGVNQWVARRIASPGYETKFRESMLDLVRPGDTVWDVGANVGFYTVRFSERVGVEGRVFAFEASPANVAQLQAAVAKCPNAVVLPLALGDRRTTVRLQQGGDRLGATSRLLDSHDEGGKGVVEVRMSRGDYLVATGEILPPNVIKIDTEGFELDVVRGLGGILDSPALRSLCIEVHFGRLMKRGVADGPRQIELILSAAGFRCMWPDHSHLIASRRPA